jgi:hypothetical protein
VGSVFEAWGRGAGGSRRRPNGGRDGAEKSNCLSGLVGATAGRSTKEPAGTPAVRGCTRDYGCGESSGFLIGVALRRLVSIPRRLIF